MYLAPENRWQLVRNGEVADSRCFGARQQRMVWHQQGARPTHRSSREQRQVGWRAASRRRKAMPCVLAAASAMANRSATVGFKIGSVRYTARDTRWRDLAQQLQPLRIELGRRTFG